MIWIDLKGGYFSLHLFLFVSLISVFLSCDKSVQFLAFMKCLCMCIVNALLDSFHLITVPGKSLISSKNHNKFWIITASNDTPNYVLLDVTSSRRCEYSTLEHIESAVHLQ